MKKLLIFIFLPFCTLAQVNFKSSEYLGNYKAEAGPFSKLIISEKEGKLYGEAVSQGGSFLKALDTKDEFLIVDYNGKAVFSRNEANQVNKVVLMINGESFVCHRNIPPLSDYVGHYSTEGAPFESLDVSTENDQLIFDVPGIGKGPVSKTSTIDGFYGDTYQIDIIFKRNDDNEVNGMLIYVQGMTIVGTLEKNSKDQILGVYYFQGAPFETLTISNKEGEFFGQTESGEGSKLMETDTPFVYKVADYDAKISFSEDGSNLKLDLMGSTFLGQKK